MQHLGYLCIVAVVNLGLGFALAVCLGRRWQTLADAQCWAALGALASAADADTEAAAAPADPAAAPASESAPQSPCQQAVAAFHQEVACYGRELSDADAQLRELAASPDISGIEACLSRLDAVSREYADHRDAAQRQLTDLIQDVQMGEETRRDLQVASQLQDVEIKRTRQGIVHFDYDLDPRRSCLEMVQQTQRLITASDRLRDTLDHTFAETLRQEDRPQAPEAAAPTDPLTGCITRAGIEARLAALWQQDPAGRRPCAALLDLDRFALVNERVGYRTGDGILAAIGRLLRTECPGPTEVARYAGQRFLLVFPDLGLHEATGVVERIRQSIEKVCFERQGADVRTTLSCAVTEALAEETVPSLLGRAETALGESKRYGRNRTFAYEGRFPTPVVPPELEIDERRLPL
jgi:diguanylate cyclase (GGDEF)-like protein